MDLKLVGAQALMHGCPLRCCGVAIPVCQRTVHHVPDCAFHDVADSILRFNVVCRDVMVKTYSTVQVARLSHFASESEASRLIRPEPTTPRQIISRRIPYTVYPR